MLIILFIKIPLTLPPQWSLKKANWNQFNDACNKHITKPNDSGNIDETYHNFLYQLDTAMAESMPKTNPDHKKTPTSWWNDECNKAILDKKNGLKTLRKTRLPEDLIKYKRACAIARKIINKEKRKDWEQLCNEMNPQTNTKKVWNKIKRIEKTRTKNNIPVLEHNGIDTITNKDKAEVFADSFTK